MQLTTGSLAQMVPKKQREQSSRGLYLMMSQPFSEASQQGPTEAAELTQLLALLPAVSPSQRARIPHQGPNHVPATASPKNLSVLGWSSL